MIIEIRKPTSTTDIQGNNWTNIEYSYDTTSSGDETTCAYASDAVTGRIIWHSWEPAIDNYDSLYLGTKVSTDGNYNDDRFRIQYSTDNGNNWNDLVSLGTYNTTLIQTITASLNPTQSLEDLQVRYDYQVQNQSDGGTSYIYDIWTEGNINELTQKIFDKICRYLYRLYNVLHLALNLSSQLQLGISATNQGIYYSGSSAQNSNQYLNNIHNNLMLSLQQLKNSLKSILETHAINFNLQQFLSQIKNLHSNVYSQTVQYVVVTNTAMSMSMTYLSSSYDVVYSSSYNYNSNFIPECSSSFNCYHSYEIDTDSDIQLENLYCTKINETLKFNQTVIYNYINKIEKLISRILDLTEGNTINQININKIQQIFAYIANFL